MACATEAKQGVNALIKEIEDQVTSTIKQIDNDHQEQLKLAALVDQQMPEFEEDKKEIQKVKEEISSGGIWGFILSFLNPFKRLFVSDVVKIPVPKEFLNSVTVTKEELNKMSIEEIMYMSTYIEIYQHVKTAIIYSKHSTLNQILYVLDKIRSLGEFECSGPTMNSSGHYSCIFTKKEKSVYYSSEGLSVFLEILGDIYTQRVFRMRGDSDDILEDQTFNTDDKDVEVNISALGYLCSRVGKDKVLVTFE